MKRKLFFSLVLIAAFLVIGSIVLLLLGSWRARTHAEMLCGAFPIESPFSVEEFAVKADKLGISVISIRPKSGERLLVGGDMWKAESIKQSELEQLRSIDRKSPPGTAVGIAGFPIHYVCEIEYSNGHVIKNSRRSFD